MVIRICLTVDHRVISKDVDLPESPIVGDKVVVWNDDGKSGLCVLVQERIWDSERKQLDLHCTHENAPTIEELEQRGWS